MNTFSINKLVRDNIPSIINESGNQCNYRILNDEEYGKELERKIIEEFHEYEQSHNSEELADLLEVIYACAAQMGISENQLNQIRQEKRLKRGGFLKKYYLETVYNKNS